MYVLIKKGMYEKKAKLLQATIENANNRTTSLLDEIVVPIRLVTSSRYPRFCKLHRSYKYSPLPQTSTPKTSQYLMTSEIQHWCSIPKGHGDGKNCYVINMG